MVLIGKQLIPLGMAYWMVCEWNPKQYLVVMHCREEIFGLYAYPCEGSKSFVRCFPLFAISVTLVVTARVILQMRIYYHLILKKVIIDFQNYRFQDDTALVVLLVCCGLAMLHFGLDLVYPPSLVHSAEKITNIGDYALPCVVFFVVFVSGCSVENHLVTVNQFYEDDPAWAKSILDNATLYPEELLRESAKRLAKDARQSRSLSLDALLNEAVEDARSKISKGNDVKDVYISLFKGFWPAKILLADCIEDTLASKEFKRSFRFFQYLFFSVHALLLVLLLSMTFREFVDVFPRPESHVRKVKDQPGLSQYESLSTGYCRDDSMERPYAYFIGWRRAQELYPGSFDVSARRLSKGRSHVHAASRSEQKTLVTDPLFNPLQAAQNHQVFLSTGSTSTKRAQMLYVPWLQKWISNSMPSQSTESQFEEASLQFCESRCSSDSLCIGFAVCPDYCTIYNSNRTEAPSGWTLASEGGARSASVRRVAQIVQTNNYELAECWSKPYTKGEPQDLVGALVCLLHVVLVSYIVYGFGIATHARSY